MAGSPDATRAVSRLSITPLKGCALQHPAEVYLGHGGVAEDRRFYLVDERGRRFTGLRDGRLVCISAHYDSRDDVLSMTFPDGRRVAGAVELGDHVTTDFFGRTVGSRVVTGRWSDALSGYAGRPLRLVKTNEPGDASDTHTITLLSLASVEELKRRSGLADLQPDGAWGRQPRTKDELVARIETAGYRIEACCLDLGCR